MLRNEMRRQLETEIISFSVNLESSWNWIIITDSISSELDAVAQQPLLKHCDTSVHCWGNMHKILVSSKRQMFGRQMCRMSYQTSVVLKEHIVVLYLYKSIHMYLIYIIIFQGAWFSEWVYFENVSFQASVRKVTQLVYQTVLASAELT